MASRMLSCLVTSQAIGRHVPPRLSMLAGEFAQRVGAPRCRRNLGAGRGEHLGKMPPDAARCAGYQHHLAGNVEARHGDSGVAHDAISFACSRSAYFWTLPVEVFGNGPKTTRPRHFVMRQIGAAPGDDVGGRNRAGIRLQCDEGAGRLAPFLVRPGDDRGFHDLRMAIQHLLDLDRGDVLAARDDDVLRAVLDLDITVGMHDREIAGVKPAAGERLIGSRGIFQITLHQRVAAQQQLADCRTVGRHIAQGFGIGDALPL